MKVLKRKDSDDAIVIAEEVEEVTPQPTKIKTVGKNVYYIDEYGKEHLRIGGCSAELETVDVTGTPEEGKEYIVKDGKLEEKLEEVKEKV